MQFVIGTTEPFERLNDVAQQFLQEALKSGMFIFLDSDLKIDQPQSTVDIDRDKTAQLGLEDERCRRRAGLRCWAAAMSTISASSGRSYKVIPQVQQRSRLNADQLLDYYIRTADGTPVPLSTVAHITTKTVPESLNHFQQLNGATIQGVADAGRGAGRRAGLPAGPGASARCRRAIRSITAA